MRNVTMRKNMAIVLILISIYTIAHSETLLSGDIGGKSLNSEGNPHIIEQDIVVPKNSKLTIKSDCVLLFKSFTGLNVYGSLIVEGTTKNPVIFTSINDANYNPDAKQLPNAFDWNGIYISEESKDTKLRNFQLMYSVYGVKSKKDDIIIQNGFFKQNGQFNFTINNDILFVQDQMTYNYQPPQEKKDVVAKEESGESQTPTPTKTKISNSDSRRKRKAAGATFLTIGILSGIVCAIMGVQTNNYLNELSTINESITMGINVTQLEEEWDKTNKIFVKTRTALIGSGIVCGISIPLSIFLFLKPDKNKTTKTISFQFLGNPGSFYGGLTSTF